MYYFIGLPGHHLGVDHSLSLSLSLSLVVMVFEVLNKLGTSTILTYCCFYYFRIVEVFFLGLLRNHLAVNHSISLSLSSCDGF
jgi:hypothetical protein